MNRIKNYIAHHHGHLDSSPPVKSDTAGFGVWVDGRDFITMCWIEGTTYIEERYHTFSNIRVSRIEKKRGEV